MQPDHEKEIRALAELAQALSRERAALAGATTFGVAFEETRYDLDRLASPVVSVVGPAKTGKSSLVNRLAGTDALPIGAVPTTAIPVCLRGGEAGALVSGRAGSSELAADRKTVRERICSPGDDVDYLVWQLPELSGTPWSWLDTPGWDALERDRALELDPWDLADVWMLTTSATHPMSSGDRILLAQLAALAAGRQVTVVVTRADQVDAAELEEILAYVRAQVAEEWPEETPQVLAVSSRSGHGIEALGAHLGRAVVRLMSERLQYELRAWRRMLDELDQLGGMTELGAVGARTVRAARAEMHRQLLASMADLKADIPRLGDLAIRSLEDDLPGARRTVAPELARRLERAVTERLDRIGQQLTASLTERLGDDLPQEGMAALAMERLTNMLDKRPPGFEPRSAALGASLGLSAGLSAALFASIPLIGVPFAVAWLGAGLAGGALGALFGGKGIIVDAEMLRDKVGNALFKEVEGEIDRAAAVARLELDRFCDVMERATALQGGEQHARDSAALSARLQKARKRADDLSSKATRLGSDR
ncbi:MAG: dynamin family protein [Polyangiaceae bacterium]